MDRSTAWVAEVLWWHVHPLGFLGAEREAPADGRITPRLGRMEPWLDHAVELGASGIRLAPHGWAVLAG